jgi:steroid delta-isomerase-like uncharacterized protein
MREIQTIVCIVVLVAQTVAEQKKTSVADMWIAAWNSHDADKVVAAFSPDVLFEDVTFSATNHGSRELRKFAASIFDAVPDAKFYLVNNSADRRHGSIEWTFSGTDRGLYKTGKRFSVRGVSVIDLRGGKISRERDYYDAASIMRQVGLLPSQNSSAAK